MTYRIHRPIFGAGALDALIRSLAPAAWFRQGVGITVTGSGVSQWDDQSGNGRHLLQGTDAARPALQGDGTVLFNGTSHFLKTNAFTLNQPTCVLMVVKQVSWTNAEYLCDGASLGSVIIQQVTSTPKIRGFAGTGSTAIDLTVGSVGVVAFVANGANGVFRVNNSSVTGDFGAANAGGLALGGSANGTQLSNIQVYEVVIFPIAPSTAQLDRLIAGLMARHGVA